MAKITIVGDAIVVTSSKKLEDIRTLEKYRPKALCLFETDENGNREEVFRIATTNGYGSINQYGASFCGETHDEEKLATITLSVPEGVKDVMEYTLNKIGTAIIMLNKVEEQFDDALCEIEVEKEEIIGHITMM